MSDDLGKLGYHEVILKCDREPALPNAQEEVQRRREGATILENSGVRDSQANGAAGKGCPVVG